MLLVKTPDYTAGQLYRQKDGKFFVVSGRPMSEASRVLGKVLNLYNEGKIKL
jgi:phage terminase large subunit-like protein